MVAVRFNSHCAIFRLVAFLAALAMAAIALGQVSQSYSDTILKNETGKPLCFLAITDQGEKLADLCITGKSATLGQNQDLVKGSGYIQALAGRYFSIVFPIRYKKKGQSEGLGNLLSLSVNRIDWDDAGRTTHVAGIKPVIEEWNGPPLQIKSDTQNPKLAGGLLTLDIEKVGTISIDIRFGGHGVPFPQTSPNLIGFRYSSRAVGDKVYEY